MSFAVWITGPPASGKTVLALALRRRLAGAGVAAVWLESDALRRILTPRPTYVPEERDRFYAELADLAALLVDQGFPVIVDATAPRRAHRARLREKAPRSLEVLVTAPLAVREARDPKGLYRRARVGEAPHLPGATEAYEEPQRPDLVISGEASADESAAAIVRVLAERSFLSHK
jgi:adenylylsulfate kinase